MPDRACLVRARTADSAPAPLHHLLVPAGIALDAQESVLQVRLELLIDEVGAQNRDHA